MVIFLDLADKCLYGLHVVHHSLVVVCIYDFIDTIKCLLLSLLHELDVHDV
jgi:hypothetical protein